MTSKIQDFLAIIHNLMSVKISSLKKISYSNSGASNLSRCLMEKHLPSYVYSILDRE